MADFTLIRDKITINAALKARIDKSNGNTILLVARQIQHEQGFALNSAGKHVVIVASEYDNNGGSINVSGQPGAAGPKGSDGNDGFADHGGQKNKPGGVGAAGGRGFGGTAATSVRIICELLRAGELRLFANGGAGGAGGEGGNGGKGGLGKPDTAKTDGFDGTSNGSGGSGGSGGTGGVGGQVFVAHIGTVVFATLLQAAGGPGGAGGLGGQPGKPGTHVDNTGKRGPSGAPGPSGAAGLVTNVLVTADDYWTHVRTELGPVTADWAAYRLAVGEYLYRAYNPEVPARADFLIRAMREFDAVLRLDPANAQATRLQRQILLNQNILGLPRELDLIPDFKQYISAFQGAGGLVLSVFNVGINEMLAAKVPENLKKLLDVQQQAVQSGIANTLVEKTAAESTKTDADHEVTEARARVAEVNNQIQAALQEMNNHSFSIGGVVGIVGEIGGAVASVAAAVPTGGASLVALVPDVIALSNSVIDNAGPVLDALFNQEIPDVNEVTDAYQNVNQNVNKVINGFDQGKTALINFVGLVHKLADGTTPDNAKSVVLVQRGVELIHAQLLAEHRAAQADQAVKAVGAKLDRANALLAKTQDLIQQLSLEAGKLRDAGVNTIHNAQMHLDSLLSFAFRAQRSVDIYTLKSAVRNLFLDAGYVEPDTERDFVELISEPQALIDAYTKSFATLLQPTQMEADYEAFFSDGNNLDEDSRRLSFTDPDLLQNFRDTHDLQFTMEVRDLPAAHFNAKVQSVFVAFVGATSPSGVISCEVRHGDRYEEKQPDGTVVVQLLQPHTDTQPARTTRLVLADVNFASPAPPLTAPQSLSFWGRGVAGRWGVSIPQSEFDPDQPDRPDLTGLSEIQVWVGYQFFR